MSDPRVRPLKPAHPDLPSASTLGHGHPFAPRTGRCRKNIQIGPWDRATRAFAVVFSRNEGPTGPRRTQTARTGVRWQYQARHAKRAKKAAAPFSIARRARVDDRPEQDGAEQGRLRQRPGRQPAVRKAGPRRRAIPPRNARTRPPRSRRSWPRLVLRKGRGDSRAHPFVDLGARAVVVREKPRRRPCPPLASTTPRPEGGGGSGPSQSGATRREGGGISNPLRILAAKAADSKKSWRAAALYPPAFGQSDAPEEGAPAVRMIRRSDRGGGIATAQAGPGCGAPARDSKTAGSRPARTASNGERRSRGHVRGRGRARGACCPNAGR